MTGHTAWIQIYESEIEQIANSTLGSPRTETGGELLGLWTHGDNPTVVLASDVTIMLAGTPGPGSRRTATTFEQDAETHMQLQQLAWENFGIQVVGLWHSHHQLSLHELSSGDVRRTMGYSRRHQRPRYSEILAYLVDDDDAKTGWLQLQNRFRVELRPYLYDNAAAGRALPTNIRVIPGESPFRSALDRMKLPSGLRKVVEGSASRSMRAPWRLANDSAEPPQAPAPVEFTHPPAPPANVLPAGPSPTPPPGSPPTNTGAGPLAATAPAAPAAELSPWPLDEIEAAIAPFSDGLGGGRIQILPGANTMAVVILDVSDPRRSLNVWIRYTSRADALVTAFWYVRKENIFIFQDRNADEAKLTEFLPIAMHDLGYRQASHSGGRLR